MKSDHFDGKKFFNPHNPDPHGIGAALKMLATVRFARWPKNVTNQPKLVLSQKLGADDVAVTFVNHATMLIQLSGMNILTDPVWSERVSPVTFAGPKRVRQPGIPFDQLPHIDLVLVSHNHYDHLDIATLKLLAKKFSPRILVAMGDKKLLERHGIDRVDEMDWWDSINIDSETKVTFAPTQHFSSRGITDRFHSLWGSFMVNRHGHNIYFGGDAGYSPHYTEIHQKLGAPSLAFLPIGAYEPRWFMSPVHMNPAEAVRAHLDLGSQKSVAIHFGCFQLTEEAIDQPVIELKAALKSQSINESDFVVLGEGQTTNYRLSQARTSRASS